MDAIRVAQPKRLGFVSRVWVAGLLACVMMVIFNSYAGAWVGLGGLVSEQLLDRDGISNSAPSISRIDTSATPPVIGMGGIVTTGNPTNATPSSIELNGTLTSLNGMPRATVYFDWGYTSAMGTESPSTTVTATGAYTITLTGFDDSRQIFYRAAVDTDGTNYGNILTVDVSTATSANLLRLIIPLIIAVAVIYYIVKSSETPIGLLMAVFMGLTVYIICILVLNALV